MCYKLQNLYKKMYRHNDSLALSQGDGGAVCPEHCSHSVSKQTWVTWDNYHSWDSGPGLTSLLSCFVYHVKGLKNRPHPVPWPWMASLPMPHWDQPQGSTPTCSGNTAPQPCSSQPTCHSLGSRQQSNFFRVLQLTKLPPASEPLLMLFPLPGTLFPGLIPALYPALNPQADCS